ncbi:hypothetical protein BLNAU_9885 [Blattamonas nauphoetae]|uniref:Uncharacterized protein n=1 Tax=Blattamonas nauphoetae TaxID=2049346 RepID=A0ABQ9XUL2_9EUKA|nr:hypothetical protein BLNAU_9885 [Blattamonas nauphoetae]
MNPYILFLESLTSFDRSLISLPDLSTCTLDKETDTYRVEIHGSTLIPCGLYFELVGESESGEPTSTKIELLPSIATSFNETFISLDLASSIVSNISSSSEVLGRLDWGHWRG